MAQAAMDFIRDSLHLSAKDVYIDTEAHGACPIWEPMYRLAQQNAKASHATVPRTHVLDD